VTRPGNPASIVRPDWSAPHVYTCSAAAAPLCCLLHTVSLLRRWADDAICLPSYSLVFCRPLAPGAAGTSHGAQTGSAPGRPLVTVRSAVHAPGAALRWPARAARLCLSSTLSVQQFCAASALPPRVSLIHEFDPSPRAARPPRHSPANHVDPITARLASARYQHAGAAASLASRRRGRRARRASAAAASRTQTAAYIAES